MRIHVPAQTHTVVSQKYSHEPFTGNILRFAKMMRAQGATVIEYGNEGSESEADEHVVLRSAAEFERLHPFSVRAEVHPGFEHPSHLEFLSRLRSELRARLLPRDIVVHGFGPAYKGLVTDFPAAVHIEPFIGYDSPGFGATRAFVSETWRHFHLGRYSQHETGPARDSYVLPPFWDLADWPIGEGKGGYFAFMARKCNVKGLRVLEDIICTYKGPCHFRFAGPGEEWQDWKDFETKFGGDADVINVGLLPSEGRAKFLGDAVAVLCPTQYVEPFGAAAIEAMLCGTPAIGSAWGTYVETLPRWAQCRTTEDWLRAMAHAERLADPRFAWMKDPAKAREDYSLETVGRTYARIFEEILTLHSPRRASPVPT